MTQHRKQMRRYEIARQPRFLTFSCYQRLPLFQNERIRQAFVEALGRARGRRASSSSHGSSCPSTCTWSSCRHLPDFPVKKVAAAIKQRFARLVIQRWKALRAPVLARIRTAKGEHRFWQHGGGYDRNVRDEAELWEKINYIHCNPITRGLVDGPLDYDWSSARWYAGFQGEALLSIDSLS